MKKFKTVIILVNYNGFDDTRDCLLSISKVEGEKPFVVIVDNNSKEKENLEKLRNTYNHLHIILNDGNVGFGIANNIGIKWAQKEIDFEYLLLLNNDTLIEPNTIEFLIEPFAIDSRIGMTTGKILYEGNREVVWYGGGHVNYYLGFPRIIDINEIASESGANKSKYVSFISGCTMMFSKKSIEVIGGFDEVFFMYCEDLELCIRAIKLNFELYYNYKSIIYHKVQGSTKKDKENKTDVNAKNPNAFFLYRHIRTNQYYVNRLHLNGFHFFIFNIFYFLTLFKTNIIMIFNLRFKVIPETFKILKFIIYNKTAPIK